MAKKSDVLVVSAYGRGNWLAAELQQSGAQVSFVDVTQSLGRWSPEDWEGPFGVLLTSELEEGQKRRLDAETPMTLNSRGLTVWASEGPIEARGPLADYKYSRMGIQEQTLNQLTSSDKKEHNQMKLLWKDRSFKESWYLNLCHNYASNCYVENIYSMQASYCPPIRGEHYLRKMDRRAYEKGLEWLTDLGVKVYSKAKITDLSFNSRFIQSVEIKSDWSGILSADQFIWSLTSLETQYMSDSVYQQIYDESLQPQWSWQRFRIEINKDNKMILPEHFLFIKDQMLTWCHDNFMIFNSVGTVDKYDVWMRLPYAERFHRSYLKDKIEAGISHLQMRCGSQLSAEVIEMPQENTYDEKDLGPTCLPVYDSEFLSHFKDKAWINLIYNSPEQWPSLEWTGRFQFQGGLRDELLQWKKSKDERQRKIDQELTEGQA